MEADLVIAATERARAQATLAGFFADAADPSQLVAVAGPRAAGRSARRSRPCSSKPNRFAANLRAFQFESDAARLCCPRR